MPLSRRGLITQLESGEVDLAIGSFPSLYGGVREQTLFREEYTCLVPTADCPEGPLTLDLFQRAQHILVDAKPLGHVHEEVEKRIIAAVGWGQIRVVSESFLLSAMLAEQTSLVLTVPSRIATFLASGRLRALKPPLDLGGFDVKQYWHERYDMDPGNIWLRSAVTQLRHSSRRRAPEEA
jgi:DNA-binding transcriptional LysR family regulator